MGLNEGVIFLFQKISIKILRYKNLMQMRRKETTRSYVS